MAIGARVRYSRAVFNNEHATEDYVTIPYRTGTYLILDNDPERPAENGNFRSGRGLDPPLRASGSHQLDAAAFAGAVDRIAGDSPELRRVVVVDLRQESHVFVDGRAMSWCADKDWSNVGQSSAWIARDERCQVEKLETAPDQLLYAVQKDGDGRVRSAARRRSTSPEPRPRRRCSPAFEAGSRCRISGYPSPITVRPRTTSFASFSRSWEPWTSRRGCTFTVTAATAGRRRS